MFSIDDGRRVMVSYTNSYVGTNRRVFFEIFQYFVDPYTLTPVKKTVDKMKTMPPGGGNNLRKY